MVSVSITMLRGPPLGGTRLCRADDCHKRNSNWAIFHLESVTLFEKACLIGAIQWEMSWAVNGKLFMSSYIGWYIYFGGERYFSRGRRLSLFRDSAFCRVLKVMCTAPSCRFLCRWWPTGGRKAAIRREWGDGLSLSFIGLRILRWPYLNREGDGLISRSI